MFEDSTFASTGKIRTRSRAGAIAAIVVELAALLVLVLFPLVYPSVLPPRFRAVLIEPPLREVRQPQQPRAQTTPATHSAINIVSISAQRVIPRDPANIVDTQGPEVALNPGDLTADNGTSSGIGNSPFGAAPAVRMARPAPPQGPVRVSSNVVSGMIIEKTLPQYPHIAVVTRTQGTVTLAAVISRTGVIENLHVVSGPAMLQQAALDAVSTWRYRPYLLNGEPVDVETTINVVFKLDE
jgi:periplasmic protein TonB